MTVVHVTVEFGVREKMMTNCYIGKIHILWAATGLSTRSGRGAGSVLKLAAALVLTLTFTSAMAARGGKDKPPNDGVEYTATLMGGFEFMDIPVTPNRKGSSYNGQGSLMMVRPEAGIDGADRATWDGVFSSCDELLFDSVKSVDAGSWKIANTGTRTSGGVARSNIRIRFMDVVAAGFQDVDIDFDLIGVNAGGGGTRFIPELGMTSYFDLTGFQFFGDGTGPESCKSFGELQGTPLMLEISATAAN